jgi:hypothetical protein
MMRDYSSCQMRKNQESKIRVGLVVPRGGVEVLEEGSLDCKANRGEPRFSDST